MIQSPTFRSSPLQEGAFVPPGGRSGMLLVGNTTHALGKKKTGLGQSRARSLGSLEVMEVRLLSDDGPVKEGMDQRRGPHEALMQRLKSRAARQEAENWRAFLATYREDSEPSPQLEAKLDALLRSTAKRSEDLRQRSEELALEVADAERRLEKVNTLTCGRASDTELQQLNAFERSQRRIQEDKREEDLQKQRDEVQANYAKVHRRLQNELIELRDYKVLLREFRRVRLEKLHDMLGRVNDGRRLRACVREMIRHGAQRILQRLEAASLPLEPWMNEVLVNCCHVEIRIEEAEERLLRIRRQALQPVRGDVEAMLSQSTQERFEGLCRRTWDGRLGGNFTHTSEDGGVQRVQTSDGTGVTWASDGAAGDMSAATSASLPSLAGASPSRRRAPEKVVAEMRAAEANITSLRRLLNDMRHNAAAVVCNHIRQVEKGGGREASKDAAEWGSQMLAMLVSEDFAKHTMKELQKSAPTAKLTQ